MVEIPLTKLKMAFTSCHLSLLGVFASIVLLDVVEARLCYYYNYYYGSFKVYYCAYYLSSGTIAGAVIGTIIGIAILIGLLVFFCCIRPRRMAARGTVLQPAGTNVAVVSTTTGVQYGGGYVNTAGYPPGTQPSYPQYTYPPQQQDHQTGYQPPPPYK